MTVNGTGSTPNQKASTITANTSTNSHSGSNETIDRTTSSPSLMVLRARVNASWKDLIYREALRMTGSLRQSGSSSNSRSQVTKRFLGRFNEMLLELRRPTGLLNGDDSDLHSLSADFEALLAPWLEILQSSDLIGSLLHTALVSLRAFLHSGMLTACDSPFSRQFVQDLVFSLAHSRFEPTRLELDEIVMLELIEFLAELVQVTIAALKAKLPNSMDSMDSNEEIVGETFLFQLFDLLFVLLNQNRFSELLKAKAVEIVVELCSLLFSALDILPMEGSEVERQITSKIHFPDIVKPQKPAVSLSSAVAVSSPKSVPLGSPNNSDSVVNVNLRENGTFMEESSSSVERPASYNPFTDEAENDLAPDAIEEVMKFRAKIAGISLDSSDSTEAASEASIDGSSDHLSSHCLKEILLFLIRCIDIIDSPKKAPGSIAPASNINTATKVIPSVATQTTAMKCLVAIFTDPLSKLSTKKTCGSVGPFETEVIALIGDDLLKQLLAILSLDVSCRHLSALSQLLLVIFTNYRSFFPAQFEYFISTSLSIISSKPFSSVTTPTTASTANSSTSASAINNPHSLSGILIKSIPKPALSALKTICLETLAYFLQDPSVIAQIFVFYECSLKYPNTLEIVTKGIAAGMEKSSGNEEIIALSGEILCNFIKTIESSLGRDHSRTEVEDLKCLLEQRRLKMIYSEASGLFNTNPKEAFAFLQQRGMLTATAPSPSEIVTFLRNAQGIDKKMLGEYLVKPNNIEILREFFSAFKFSESTTIDCALRQVLESFRLPGEAQQIDRIMECFSEIFYPSARSVFTSQDGCYVLAFSTLMLNTDLHNPQVKHKMSLPDFLRNNRGINDGKDVDEAYLSQLYNSIKTREIVMPEERGGEEAFSSQWNEVQGRAAVFPEPSKNFDSLSLTPLVCGIVEIVWKPIITSLIPYINQQRPTGEIISEGPLESLRGIASLFEKFEMTEALEALLGNIWSVSNVIPVFSAASGNMIPRYLARLPGFRQVVLLIVDIFRGQGGGLRVGWTNWGRLLIILSESGILEAESVVTQDSIFFDSRASQQPVSLLSLLKMAHEARQVQPAGKVSFMSSLSRFFVNSSDSGSAGASANNSNASNASNAGNGSGNDEIISTARQFVSNQLPLMDVLCESIPGTQSRESFVACIESMCLNLKWNLGEGNVVSGSGKRNSSTTASLNWTEDTLIVVVESVVTIGLSIEMPNRLVEDFFPIVFDTFTRLVLQESMPPVRLCEHAVVGLGRLILRMAEIRQLAISVFVGYLKFWCQMSPQLQSLTLEPALALIILTIGKIRQGSDDDQFATVWPPLFTILSTVSKLESSSPYVLKLLELIPLKRQVSSIEEAKHNGTPFPLEFYSEYLDLLSGSITSCSEINHLTKIYDPWRGGEGVTRVQLAEESVMVYERLFYALDSEDESMWVDYLVPLESSLARIAPMHSVKRIRQVSINLLSRLLPHTPQHMKSSVRAPVLFSKILIPLLIDLRMRPGDTDEIVMRSASLVCKVFLANLGDLGIPAGRLWREVLEALVPLLVSGGPSEALREGVLESCKNVLLVMHSTDEIRSDSDVWRVTDVLLGPLIPEWKLEIEMRMGEGEAILVKKDEAQVEDVNNIQVEEEELNTVEIDNVINDDINDEVNDTIVSDNINDNVVSDIANDNGVNTVVNDNANDNVINTVNNGNVNDHLNKNNSTIVDNENTEPETTTTSTTTTTAQTVISFEV